MRQRFRLLGARDIPGADHYFALFQRRCHRRDAGTRLVAHERRPFGVDDAVGANQSLGQCNRDIVGRFGQPATDRDRHAAPRRADRALTNLVAHDPIQHQGHLAGGGVPLLLAEGKNLHHKVGGEIKLLDRQKLIALLGECGALVAANCRDQFRECAGERNLLAPHARFIGVILVRDRQRRPVLGAQREHVAHKGEFVGCDDREGRNLPFLCEKLVAKWQLPREQRDQQNGGGKQHQAGNANVSPMDALRSAPDVGMQRAQFCGHCA